MKKYLIFSFVIDLLNLQDIGLVTNDFFLIVSHLYLLIGEEVLQKTH